MRSLALALLYPVRYLVWELDAPVEDGDATAAVLYSR